MMRILILSLLIIVNTQGFGQHSVIPLVNPSFEGQAAAGTYQRLFNLASWHDCAPYYFKYQTPPDVQQGSNEFFDVRTTPQNGNTYLGMVTRQNESWELVSQRLIEPLEKGNCYEFQIHLARSESYFSSLLVQGDTTKKMNFNKPIVLRIWGGRNVYEKRELLAESKVVEHTEWRNYIFEFNCNQDHEYLILEAFYRTPTLLPYNGNILIDNASDIRQIYCPGEEGDFLELAEVEEVAPKSTKVGRKVAPKKLKSNQKQEEKPIPEEKIASTHKPKILHGLDKNKIREGSIIKIEQLFFKADSSSFTGNSFKALDEVYDFLVAYPNVIIEIGGHTNSIPGREYCHTLSLKRAKAVASYLYEKGIPNDRIIYKGYGKDKPIASNKSFLGRQKNQRVEIKILKTG